MAHLFEHLMFGPTRTLPPGEFDRLVEGTGGESNAATWVDWTYYRLSLPARDLPLGIRLESGRMQNLVLEPTPVEAERDVVTNERRERIVRAPKPIATDRLLIGYKAPGQDDPDWATLEIVATLLAGCPSARLYRRLVIEGEAASSVDAQLTPFRDPSLLRLAVTASRGHSADEIVAAIDRELARMAEQPPRHAEVEKAKAIAETDFWTSLVDVDGKAEAIGHYETALGDFRKVNAIAERLAAVTTDDVARCVRGYLRSERRTVVIAEPESADDGEGGDEDDYQDGDD
jgi:zinc protease